MHLRLQTTKARRLARLRLSTIEPVLRSLINFTAMRQVNTKGIALANKCMLMAAIAYNLKNLVKDVKKRADNQSQNTFSNERSKTIGKSLSSFMRFFEAYHYSLSPEGL
jgi:hypothetical protein